MPNPDARAVLSSFMARNGRQPTLVELFRELAVEPSGNPADAAEPALRVEAEPSPAQDDELTAQMQMRELCAMFGDGPNPLMALLYPGYVLAHRNARSPRATGPSNFQPAPPLG